MTWRNNLRPASFRGVEFHIDERQFNTGRRIHNHEFPKRNTNFPEDMGKKTRHISVTAYLVGDDYMARRDRLLDACEREGSGQYVDHWGRSQTVVCESCELVETRQDGRYCKFSLKFLEAGGGAMPSASIATAAQLIGSATGLLTTGLARFGLTSLVGQNPLSISRALNLPLSSLPQAIQSRIPGAPIRKLLP